MDIKPTILKGSAFTIRIHGIEPSSLNPGEYFRFRAKSAPFISDIFFCRSCGMSGARECWRPWGWGSLPQSIRWIAPSSSVQKHTSKSGGLGAPFLSCTNSRARANNSLYRRNKVEPRPDKSRAREKSAKMTEWGRRKPKGTSNCLPSYHIKKKYP